MCDTDVPANAATIPQVDRRQHTQFSASESRHERLHGSRCKNFIKPQRAHQRDGHGIGGPRSDDRGAERPARSARVLRGACSGWRRATATVAIFLAMAWCFVQESSRGDGSSAAFRVLQQQRGALDYSSAAAAARCGLHCTSSSADRRARLQQRGAWLAFSPRPSVGSSVVLSVQQQQRGPSDPAAAAWRALYVCCADRWASQQQRSPVDATAALGGSRHEGCTARSAWLVRRMHRMRGQQFACNRRRRRE